MGVYNSKGQTVPSAHSLCKQTEDARLKTKNSASSFPKNKNHIELTDPEMTKQQQHTFHKNLKHSFLQDILDTQTTFHWKNTFTLYSLDKMNFAVTKTDGELFFKDTWHQCMCYVDELEV